MVQHERVSTKHWLVEVRILPKDGVNDPQGEAVRSGLIALGYSQAGDVRVGKLLHVELAARDSEAAARTTRSMCDRLLANPVIETYQIGVLSELFGSEAETP